LRYRLTLLLLILLNLTRLPAAAQTAPGVIVFSTSIEDKFGESVGANQLYQVNADGTGLTLLLDDLRAPVVPVWSPDGRYLAFRIERALYVLDMSQPGALPLRLPRPLVIDSGDFIPAWTLDSQRLLFVKTINGSNLLYSVGLDGSAPTRLSLLPVASGQLAVLSDGRIAFQTPVERNFWPVVVVEGDGSSPVFMTVGGVGNRYQACGFDWSPVAFRLVINISTDYADCISVSAPSYTNTAGDTVLTSLPTINENNPYFYGFSWSPDGSHVAAATYDLAPIGYYTFSPDGSDSQYIGGETLAPETESVFTPQVSNITWSSDNQQLAFAWSYFEPPGAVLYVTEADGSGSTPIIRFNPDIVRIISVAWQPVS
jgi:hypothetical protein